MYLIRGQHNLDLFNSRFPRLRLCGTIGNFDGLHLGHQAILNKVKKNAQQNDAKTIVFFYRATCLRIFCEGKRTKYYASTKDMSLA